MKKPASDSLSSFARTLDPDQGASLVLEDRLSDEKGYGVIAGTDEAGRGPLAGPVVAAAVILDRDNIPVGLADSKKLTAKKREQLFEEILASSVVSWCAMNAATIDRINIRQASLTAMASSIKALYVPVNHVLVDGRDVPSAIEDKGHAIIKGDALSLSIAAASIIAKVVRDRMMNRFALLYPQYGFERHKGYGSKAHMAAIKEYGPCPIHRMSFKPLRQEE